MKLKKKIVEVNLLPATLSEFLDNGLEQTVGSINFFDNQISIRIKVESQFIFEVVTGKGLLYVISSKSFKLNEEGYQRMVHYLTHNIIKMASAYSEESKKHLKYFEQAFVEE